jgi:DNA-directed RNA polymerase subunit RPC12/RpoP
MDLTCPQCNKRIKSIKLGDRIVEEGDFVSWEDVGTEVNCYYCGSLLTIQGDEDYDEESRDSWEWFFLVNSS